MPLTGVHTHGNGIQCYNRGCDNAPDAVRGVSRCRCKGYPATTRQGDCTVCGAAYYEYEYQWRADIPADSGGFGNWAKHCHGDGQDDYGNRCVGYANSEFPCTKCCAQNDIHNSGGFVETEQEDMYPVTVMVFMNTHGKKNTAEYVKISNIKESSITIEERKGIQTLVCESFVTNCIAYVPYAVWYMTEVQSGIVD